MTWAGRGRSLLTRGDIEANPGPGGWRLVALLAWLSLWAFSPLSSLSLAPVPATVCHVQGALGMCAAPARTGANCTCITGWGGEGTVTFRSAHFLRRSDIELLSCVCWPGQVVSWVHFCDFQIFCIQGTPLFPASRRPLQFFAIPATDVARFDAYARRPRAQEPPLAAGLGSSPPPSLPPQPPGADWGREGLGAVRRHSPPPWGGIVAGGASERHLPPSPRGGGGGVGP